jgi:DUF218 domain
MAHNLMNRFFLSFIVLVFSLTSFSQQQKPSPSYQLITGNSIIQAKNYYLLTLLQETPAVKSLISADAALAGISKTKLEQLASAMKNCRSDFSCYTSVMKFSPDEIKLIGERLAALYKPGNAIDKMIREQLIPSGTYERYNDGNAQQLLVKAWEQDANGINFTIGVYAEGRPANYPLIDSCSLNVKSRGYNQMLFTATQTILDDCRKSSLFFLPSMMSALRFLELNERYDAADYEPMASTVNKAAFDRVKKIDWSKYKYSVIVIPGAGPNDPKVPLSGEGLLRCRIAAQRYFEGLAPFIITSGGRVHPYKTIYSEAYEMKKYLMEQMNVPENAIIMDPHARHTTTNMRNAARLIFHYGIPFDKIALTSTARGQSSSIGTTLADRCQKELNIIPFRIANRLSDTEVEFYPLVAALTINPLEPLDP